MRTTGDIDDCYFESLSKIVSRSDAETEWQHSIQRRQAQSFYYDYEPQLEVPKPSIALAHVTTEFGEKLAQVLGTAQPGDKLAHLAGCPCPCVLRATEKDSVFELVGDS